MKRSTDKTPSKLALKKETLRQLKSLTDDELRRAAGGATGQPSILSQCGG